MVFDIPGSHGFVFTDSPLVSEKYSVAQIRKAFTDHADPDDWGVECFYVNGIIAALRGEYDEDEES